MKTLHFAVIVLALSPAGARAGASSTPEPGSDKESWNALNPEYSQFHSFAMEAAAIMGEVKYQHGDFSSAGESFRDSLNSSTKLMTPQGHYVELDLYRSAQLAAQGGEYDTARQNLEILINRFPNSEWADRGRYMLDRLPKKNFADSDSTDPATPAVVQERPESLLGRIQLDLKRDQGDAALSDAQEFIERYPSHASVLELRLLIGALELRANDPAKAAEALKAVAERADGELRGKALYLLAGARLALGDYRAVLDEIPSAAGKNPWLGLAQAWRAAAEDKLGRPEKAVALYQESLKTGLDSPIKAYALAAVAADRQRRGQIAEAATDLGRAAAEAKAWGLEDLEAATLLAEGHILYRNRRYDAAARAYARFLVGYPKHPGRPVALYQEGLTLRRLGKKQQALAAFSEILDRYASAPQAVDAHLQLGQIYTELGAPEKAIAHYKGMGESGVKTSQKESLLLVAQVHYNNKEFKDAIPLYWSFLEQYPDDEKTREVEELLLNAYWLGDREDPGLMKALSLYPNHAIVAHIRWELGAEAYKAGDFQKAGDLFDRFAADFPRSPHAAESLFFEGESATRLSDPARAAQAYRALISRFPRDANVPAASFKLGLALYQAGDFAGSAEAYHLISNGKDPLAADALYNRALSLAKAGRKTETLPVYERLLQRFPKYPKAPAIWFQVGQLREAAGNPAGAAKAYARVTGPDRAQALFNVGRIEEKFKKTDLAMKAYAQLAAARPASDPARLSGLLRLGLLYELRSQPKKAMPLYSEVMRWSQHQGPLFEAARKRVAVLTNRGGLGKS